MNENISIHAAREGGDSRLVSATATAVISIHAAREGGDRCRQGRTLLRVHFNPRRP